MADLPKGSGGFLNPEKVLSELEIKAPSRVADFGCGHGYFTIPLAKMVGKEGLVFALDVLKEALNEVSQKAEKEGLKNIETIRCNLEVPGGSKMPDNSCDMVILANILYQSQKKAEILKEATRVTKSNGKMVVIDWESGGRQLTQESGWRVSPDEVKSMADGEGLNFERSFDVGNFHYGLIFSKT